MLFQVHSKVIQFIYIDKYTHICVYKYTYTHMDFPGGSVVKNLPANAGATGDVGSIPGLGRSLGKGNGDQLQYSCLGNPVDS